jgi:SAM-dependent methyltransferase
MNHHSLHPHSIAHIAFQADWQSDQGRHSEILHVEKFNVWRDMDLLPDTLARGLLGQPVGGQVETAEVSAGTLVGDWQASRHYRLPAEQFVGKQVDGSALQPHAGRFYPQGMLYGAGDVFQGNMQPMRMLNVNEETVEVDLNHPISRHALKLSARVVDLQSTDDERGGRCSEVVNDLLRGPGMQIRHADRPTDFLVNGALKRVDENVDAVFYSIPRMVQHLDSRCLQALEALHGRILPNGGEVLDLMASHDSHIPQDKPIGALTGLGMNADELNANARLSHSVVQDLNRDARLPFTAGRFAAVICTASVEYLSNPLEVFEEVARVLAPGGIFVVSFSNRWFPTKTVGLWCDLHEFERLGLVSEYFLQAGGFGQLHSLSQRGLSRPETDAHYGRSMLSDPLYAVWASKQP